MGSEFLHLCIGQRFERRSVPGPPPLLEYFFHGLQSDPGLAGAGGRCDQAISGCDRFDRFELKWVGHKRGGIGRSDTAEYFFETVVCAGS